MNSWLYFQAAVVASSGCADMDSERHLELSQEMHPMESGDLQALRKLVQKTTNQNEERLDAAQAKQIRDFAKKGEDNVRLVQELLMDRLKWPHAEVRHHAAFGPSLATSA